jgi:hypothetical protein
MDNIKIVRLQSGDDIIANYTEDEESGLVRLERPMALFFKRLTSGKSMMMMSPWLPLELIKDNSADLYSQDILTVIEPRQSLVEYYTTAMNEAQQLIEDASEALDDCIRNEDEFDDEDEDLGPAELTEMIQELKGTKTIH